MKNSISLYAKNLYQIEPLDMIQRGELFTALLLYASGQDSTLPDPLTRMAFLFLKAQIDEEAEKKAAVRAARAEAGRRGGSARAAAKKTAPKPETVKDQQKTDGKPAEVIPYKEIVDFLNKKAGTSFRDGSKATRDKIRARYNEGFRLDDFKTVISKKTEEWKGSDMQQFLRPETLFGTKFEGYLNGKAAGTGKKNAFHNFTERETDYDSIIAEINGF